MTDIDIERLSIEELEQLRDAINQRLLQLRYSNRRTLPELLRMLEDYMRSVPGFDEIMKFLQDPLGNLQRLITDFLTNPAEALVTWWPLLFAVFYQVFTNLLGWPTWGAILASPLLVPLAITLGVTGIVLLVDHLNQPPADQPGEPEPPAPVRAEQPVPAVAGLAPSGVPAGGGAPAGSAVAPSAPAAGAAAAPAPFVPYAVRGFDPGEGFTPTLREETGAKAPAADIHAAAAAAAAAAARDRRRARRKRGGRITEPGYGFMDMDPVFDPEPPAGPEPARVRASERGSGPLGFTGTVTREGAAAAGLTTLAGDAFDTGPTSPMLPGTWSPGDDAPDTTGPTDTEGGAQT